MNILLNRTECAALRGLAIIGIFLHNYCHWLGGIVRENEYQFHQRNVDGLQYALNHPDLYLPVHLLSFFGHYGVPLFLFLSAYGLVLKYESSPALIKGSRYYDGAWTFIRRHFTKLWLMMFVGFAAFILIDTITPGARHYEVRDILGQLIMLNNFNVRPDKDIWPGPYWFFGLMIQLYIVYRLLLYRRHWGWTLALMVVCTAIQMACEPEGEALNRWRYNCVGGMLPFGFGLLCARMPMQLSKGYCWLFAVVSLMLIYSQSMSYYSWFFVPVMVCAFGFTFVKVLPSWLLKGLAWMGGISAALFVCHPVTRKIIISHYRGDIYAGLLLYIIGSIALAWLFREVMNRINRKP